MAEAKPKPKVKGKIKVVDSSSLIELFDPKGEIATRFDFYIKFVIGILVVAIITMLLIVVQLVIEAYRFNSTVYKELKQIQIQESLIENVVEQQEKTNELLNSIDARLEELEK